MVKPQDILLLQKPRTGLPTTCADYKKFAVIASL